MLIPDREDSYYYKYDDKYDQSIPIPEWMNLKADSVNLNQYDIEGDRDGNILLKGYTGPSLLFFKIGNYDYYYQYYKHRRADYEINYSEINTAIQSEKMKDWLRSRNRDRIYAAMKDFEALQKKHKMKIVLTPDAWFKRIYKPPFFRLDKSITIASRQLHEYETSNSPYYTEEDYEIVTEVVADTAINFQQYVDEYSASFSHIPYLQYTELESGYKQVLKYYEKDKDENWLLLFISCVTLCLSIFIFSFRITGGKPWLIAFVGSGVLIFITVLSGLILGEASNWRYDEFIVIFILMIWIIIFSTLLFRIISKIKRKSNKGRSNIYINLLIWLVPCIIPLLFFILAAFNHSVDREFFNITDEVVMNMFWFDILAMIPAMWGVSSLVHKWKSIAEE